MNIRKDLSKLFAGCVIALNLAAPAAFACGCGDEPVDSNNPVSTETETGTPAIQEQKPEGKNGCADLPFGEAVAFLAACGAVVVVVPAILGKGKKDVPPPSRNFPFP